MSDDVWRRNEIASPCVKICVIHPETKLCAGCGRTTDEIRDWSRYSDQQRAEIMDQLKTRQSQSPKRRGGRAARLKR